MAPTNLTRVVAAVMASSMEETLRAAESGTVGADFVELRADAIREPDLRKLRAAAGSRPLIFTCRSPRQGGMFRGSETERVEMLRGALALGFDYVDVELEAMNDGLRAVETSSRLILSHHDFDRLPADPLGLVEKAAAWGADVVKLAGRCSSLADVIRLGEVSRAVQDRGLAFAPVTMGPAGVAGRVLASRLGAAMTYAAARGLPATGPGQLDLDELLHRYRFRSLDAATEIYGIVGRPVVASLSPVMHNDFFGRQGQNAIYLPFEEEDLPRFVAAAKELGVAGLSVTRPFKESMLAHLEELDQSAKEIGAVNTVAVRDGKWRGFNTDAEGVVRPISRRSSPAGKRAVILGAGGAARAAAVGLRRAGAEVAVLARRPEQARAVAAIVSGQAGGLAELAGRPWDILVNATPLSSGLVERGREPASLRPGAVVLDMVYDPERTELLDVARERGAMEIPGLEMLVAQAVCQATIWTGREPVAAEMENAAREELARRAARADAPVAGERLAGSSRKSAR